MTIVAKIPHNIQIMIPKKLPVLTETVASLLAPLPVAVALAVPPVAAAVAAALLAVALIVCSCNEFQITPVHEANCTLAVNGKYPGMPFT